MGAKYSFLPFVIATPVVGALLVMSVACNDDFGYRNVDGQPVAFKLEAAAGWHSGMTVDENAATTHCTSVRPLSGGDTKLYLHTVVADNPARDNTVRSRGTLLTSLDAFKRKYSRFSLSGICFTGDYPTDESELTPNYAYNLNYNTADGKSEDQSGNLYWPSGGNVRFFGFAPTVADFNELETGGTLTLSEADVAGAPTLTYIVPTDVTKQVDLMTVQTDAGAKPTADGIELKFGHALTAIRITCDNNMLAGTVTKVSISGVHGKGTQVIGSTTWTTSDPATYTIKPNKELKPAEGSDDKIHTSNGTAIAGTDDDNLTFILLPQTLPDGAKLTIEFTDKATNTQRTVSGNIGGQTWEAGKIVNYVVSPNSINVKVKVKLSKDGITNPTETPDPLDKTTYGDTIPYSGVWYDATYNGSAEIVQYKEDGTTDTKKIEDIPIDKISFQYQPVDSAVWTDCINDENGLLTIAAQPAYTTMRSKFKEKGIDLDKESTEEVSLTIKGETANCYLVDRAGYYSLPLVYGNGKNLTVQASEDGTKNGLQYFPGYDNKSLPTDGIITDADDAVLVWQDAPDLIDPKSVKIENGKLFFRICKHTLTQGNAVLAVRKNEGGKKVIIWSWHIWVTPYKDDFYSQYCTSTTYQNMANKTEATELREYKFAKFNLGWCDSHAHNFSRKFRLRAVIKWSALSAYGISEPSASEPSLFTVDIPGEFTQMEYRGSDAGDNTYYQWGRKDPMLGGIRNAHTPKYVYYQRGTKFKNDEFNMENKQLFNQYKEDDGDYRFCKNIGDKLTELPDQRWGNDGNSHGVFIGYTIQHPYMFITNSRMQYVDPKDATKKPEGGDPLQTDLGLDPDFNFRGHWHKPRALDPAPYLIDSKGNDDHIMFNAWDAGALNPGKLYTATNTEPTWGSTAITDGQKNEYKKTNASNVLKTVYDPCPPGFKMPPIDAFRGATAHSVNGNACTITFGKGGSTVFPLTGVRDYALRSNEWKTVEPATGGATDFNKEKFYRTTMPAFGLISFVSTATLVMKDVHNRYQLLYFDVKTHSYSGTSSNSYGMPVRPIRDGDW